MLSVTGHCQGERALIHSQKPTITNDIAAEGVAPQQSAAADLANRLRDELRERFQRVLLAAQTGIQEFAI